MEPTIDDDILKEKIKAYRESLKGEVPDLDIELLMKVLDMVNESSEVKVAISPVTEGGGWDPNAPTYAVAGITTLDDGRISLRVHDERHGIEAGTLYLKIKKALKRRSGSKMPVIFSRKGNIVQLTDVYSHALVRQMYAGMPFDVVLAFSEKKDGE